MDKMYQNYKTLRSANPLVVILALVFGLLFVFWFIKNIIFKILYLIAPALFVIALVLNYKVVLGYGIWLWNSLKNNPLFGLAAIALTILAYPFVGAYLALRAYQLRGKGFQKKPKKDGEYIKYTEVESEDFLDISKEKQKKSDLAEEYGDLL